MNSLQMFGATAETYVVPVAVVLGFLMQREVARFVGLLGGQTSERDTVEDGR